MSTARQPMPIGGGVTINAGELFAIARAAYERTRDASFEQRRASGDPLIAIIFSAAALEAFINEAGRIASLRGFEPPPDSMESIAEAVENIEKSDVVKEIEKSGGSVRIAIPDPEPPSVGIFADALKEIEDSHGSIRLKFLLARAIFAGKAYDKGARPYQDFALLMTLRDELLHLKAGSEFDIGSDGAVLGKRPSITIIGRLRSKNILAEIEDPAAASLVPLTWRVSTHAAARWACDTAVEMVASIIEVVPASELKASLERHYSNSFRRVE